MKNILLTFITVSILTATPAFSKRELTLEKIWLKSTFSQKSVYGLTSMKDGLHYTVLETKDGKQQINKYSYEKGTLVATVLNNDLKTEKGEPLEIEDYDFSEDEKMLLLKTNSEHIYRHSMKSEYYVFNTGNKKLTRIGEGKSQLAAFSPDGQFVSYMRDNNLYLFDLKKSTETAITSDGKWNHIINGAPDWVYEEEFVLVKAYAWSPDSKHLAYYRFDESEVKEFSFPMYTGLYPDNYVYKYPKAGEKNSDVQIEVYSLAKKSTYDAMSESGFEYVPRIAWTNIPNVLSIQLMNRLQNEMQLMFVDVEKNSASKVLHEKVQTYMEVHDFEFLKDGKTMLGMNEKSGFNQIYQYEITSTEKDGKTVYAASEGKAITEAGREVAELIGTDEQNRLVYYQSFSANDAVKKDIMVYHMQTMKNTVFTLPEGENRLSASANMKYFINYNSAPERPLSVALYDNQGKKIRVLEDNKALADTLSNYDFGTKEFFRFTGRSGDELQGWMIKPIDFKEGQKYPVLMFVYGGPGSQTVTGGWGGANDIWYRYLANKGYIMVSVDNRGTGGRGQRFRDCTYGQLGKLESEDQIDAAVYLQQLPFVDKYRIGIWGWSYGGYMSTLCLAKGGGIFKMAVAVAPVTNWRFYDSIYTERYMGLPADNAKGYDDNSPVNHAGKIKGPFLLVHGTADDNVHFQNSVELIDELVKNNVQFDLAIYPNKNHGIYGGNTRYHLFTKITDFIQKNL